MNSRISLDTLWECHAQEFLRNTDVPKGTYVSAQDTEDNNETEVYVYVPANKRDTISRWLGAFAEWMGLDRTYVPMTEEPCDGHPYDIRLQYIVTICHITGEQKAFV